MSNEEAKVRRTLQLRFTLPTSDSTQLIAMIKAATPFYQMFGKAEVRLLQNVDDQTKFVQEIEYEANEDWELSRHRIAGDWRRDREANHLCRLTSGVNRPRTEPAR